MNQDQSTTGHIPEPAAGVGLEQSAEQMKHSAQEEFERIKGAAREQTSAAFQQIKENAQTVAQQAKAAGTGFFNSQRQNLVRRVDAYAECARTAADTLRGSDGGSFAGAVDTAAEQLTRVSGYFREREPMEVVRDVEDFARRRPEIIFGGMFLLGLAASRFLKASRPRPEWEGVAERDEASRSRGEVIGTPPVYSPKMEPVTGPTSNAWGDV